MSKIKKIELSFKCDEDWDKMRPVDKGRHCAACKKPVIDFSNYTDKQIVSFYESPPNTKTCGRFRIGQLENLNENLAAPIPKKDLSFMRPIFAGALLTAACSSDPEMGEIIVETVRDKSEKFVDSSLIIGKFVPIDDAIEHKKGESPNTRTMGESGVVFENNVDSTKPKIQVIPEVTIGGKSMSTVQLAYVSHTAGVPILTHEEVEIKNSLWKRIAFKIKRVFRRKD